MTPPTGHDHCSSDDDDRPTGEFKAVGAVEPWGTPPRVSGEQPQYWIQVYEVTPGDWIELAWIGTYRFDPTWQAVRELCLIHVKDPKKRYAIRIKDVHEDRWVHPGGLAMKDGWDGFLPLRVEVKVGSTNL